MKIKIIKRSDIARCPNVIFLPDHYRDDGSCKCNDQNDPDMPEWGYVWDSEIYQWKGRRR